MSLAINKKEKENEIPKIPIESYNDINYILGNLHRKTIELVKEELPDAKENDLDYGVSCKLLKKWISAVIESCGKNVLVNGMEFDRNKIGADRYEPFDEELQNEVERLQFKRDMLLAKVCSKRKSISQQFEQNVKKLLTLEVKEVRELNPLEALPEIKNIPSIKGLDQMTPIVINERTKETIKKIRVKMEKLYENIPETKRNLADTVQTLKDIRHSNELRKRMENYSQLEPEELREYYNPKADIVTFEDPYMDIEAIDFKKMQDLEETKMEVTGSVAPTLSTRYLHKLNTRLRRRSLSFSGINIDTDPETKEDSNQ